MDKKMCSRKPILVKKGAANKQITKFCLMKMVFKESMYNTELSVVEPNGADASEGTCKLPVFFFDGMNKTTQ